MNEGMGLGGIVFIVVTLICLFIFNLKAEYSLLIGGAGALIVYLIQQRDNII